MKKIMSLVLVLMMLLTFSSCAENTNSQTKEVLPPMIDMHGQKYVAPHMPVDELPEGYTYYGKLTEEQANGTGLEGHKIYALKELDSITDFYLYQECGTPIDENSVDNEKIQWAYVQWIQVKSE